MQQQIPLKAKTRFTKNFAKKKTHNKGEFMESSYRNLQEPSYNITKNRKG